ncbi:MAG TPA: aldo/keto reductase [Actinomycetota bacterium]|nr:aldo/keto reductase [Actinomycetota bacterium]
MIYRKLGRTGVEVSALCLGTMMFGKWGNQDVDECVRIIHAALDAGINFVDTADVYSQGEAEEILAWALKNRRDEVVLATKVHGRMGEGRNRSGNSRLWITKEVENSLRRLNTDYIDLYQIHRPDPSTDIEETLGALTDLVHAGKVRYIGCSTFPAAEIVEAHWASERHGFARFVCEQPPYSLLVRGIERDVLAVTQRYGMGVIAWSPLAGGWLTGKYRRGADIPEESRAARIASYNRAIAARFDLSLPVNQRKQDLVEELQLVADKAGISLTHMANAFVLTHPAVTASIIGPRTMEQLLDLLEGADVTLDAETLDAIDDIVTPGSVVNDIDRGWTPPWLEADARRR